MFLSTTEVCLKMFSEHNKRHPNALRGHGPAALPAFFDYGVYSEMVKVMHLIFYSNVLLPYLHPPYEPSTPPSLRAQVLQRIERSFEEKLQIKLRLAGFGQPTKREDR